VLLFDLDKWLLTLKRNPACKAVELRFKVVLLSLPSEPRP
jgi:hypothetical protein